VDPEATRTSSTAKRDATASDLIATIRSIYASSGNGLAGFYQGIASDTLSTALSNFLFFYMHAALSALATRRLRQIASHDKGAVDSVVMKLSGGKELLIGVLAGVASRGITTPLSVITVRKQTASKVASKPEHPGANETAVEDEDDYDSDWASDSSVAIARDIYAEMGISGFWRGYSSACLLVGCLTFPNSLEASLTPAMFSSDDQSGHHVLPHCSVQTGLRTGEIPQQSESATDVLHLGLCVCDSVNPVLPNDPCENPSSVEVANRQAHVPQYGRRVQEDAQEEWAQGPLRRTRST
jgi:hypothetical protein